MGRFKPTDSKRLGINPDDLRVPHFRAGVLSRKTVEELVESDLIKEDLPHAIDYLSKPNERGTALAVTEKLFVDRQKLRNLVVKGSNIESVLNLGYTFKVFLSNDVPLVGECEVIDGQITGAGIYIPVDKQRPHPTDVFAVRTNTGQDPKPFFPADFLKKGTDYKPIVEYMLQEYARKE